MNKRSAAIVIVIAAIVVVSGVSVYLFYGSSGKTGSGTGSGTVTLKEDGSSLLYPAFNVWAGNYTAATVKPAPGGSSKGISDAENGVVNIGGSDAYLSSPRTGVMNIPILISYQDICYNIPGLSPSVHLNLTGGIIAGIYMGTITSWNNSLIKQYNPGVSLPNHPIVPVHRSDGSGDTFMFTSFLSKANATWNSKVGTSTQPNWPTGVNYLEGDGNTGIIAKVSGTSYSIGYIAATYNSTIVKDKFGVAHLQNKAGNFVAPTVGNVKAAAANYLSSIPASGTIALQYAPGASSYPIADMEYVIVKVQQTNSQTAQALQAFLAWIMNSTSGGSQAKFLEPLNLAPLPGNVVQGISMKLVDKITG